MRYGPPSVSTSTAPTISSSTTMNVVTTAKNSAGEISGSSMSMAWRRALGAVDARGLVQSVGTLASAARKISRLSPKLFQKATTMTLQMARSGSLSQRCGGRPTGRPACSGSRPSGLNSHSQTTAATGKDSTEGANRAVR